MNKDEIKNQRLIALFLLGCLLLNYPLLYLFNRFGLVLGAPTVYFYLFFAWAVLIWLMALVCRKSR